MDEEIIFITAQESGERIDALLSRNISILSRSAVQKLIEGGSVYLVSGRNNTPTCGKVSEFVPVLKKNRICSEGETFSVSLPPAAELPLAAQDIPLDIVYEDSSVIVVNKQRGLVVHPAPGHWDGTLVNALLYHCGDTLSGIGGEKRPGIVHRIDKDTSGLIIVAKNDYAHRFLSAQLSDKTLSRIYNAVVVGTMREASGTVNRPIGRHPADRVRMAVTELHSKPAVTHWSLIDSYKGYSHISCRLETGRTHQIRVHMASIGHPLLGDSLYGAKSPDKGLEGQCLHASKLRFIHPDTKEAVELTCPLPDYFTDVLSRLGPVTA